jgi:hypothetical protein
MPKTQNNAVTKIQSALIGWMMFMVAFCVLELVIASQAYATKGLTLVGSTSEGQLWYTIRQSNGQWLLFDNILTKAGRPWQVSILEGYISNIEDVAIQLLNDVNDLLGIVLIKETCMRSAVITRPNLCERRGSPQTRYSVWQTVQRSQSLSWEPFVNVTAQLGNHSFRRIGLAREASGLINFCGATTQGDVFISTINTLSGMAWLTVYNLKELANFDPGPVTDVSCSDNKFSGTFSVAMVANGRVYHTFADTFFAKSYKNVPVVEVGMDDLTARIGIPELVQEVAVAATDGYTDLHLVVGAPDTSQYHSLTHFPPDTATGWTGAGNVSSVVGHPGRVVATAITNLFDDLHLYNVTEDGVIWGAVRRSSDGVWTSSLDSMRTGFDRIEEQAGYVGSFTHVAVTYFDDSPEYRTNHLNKPTNLRVENVQQTSLVLTYLNNSDYANRVQVFLRGGPNGTLVYNAPTGLRAGVGLGVRGTISINDSTLLTPGTTYAVHMQAFSAVGGSDNSDDLPFTTEEDPNEIVFVIKGDRAGILTVPNPVIRTAVNQIYWELCNMGRRPQRVSTLINVERSLDTINGIRIVDRWCAEPGPDCTPTTPPNTPNQFPVFGTCDPKQISCMTDSWPEPDTRIVAPGICVWQRAEQSNIGSGCRQFLFYGQKNTVENPLYLTWFCRSNDFFCTRIEGFAPEPCLDR